MIPSLLYFRTGQYKLLVRRSVTNHAGQPRLHFFNNKNYYCKFMNRRLAVPNDDDGYT